MSAAALATPVRHADPLSLQCAACGVEQEPGPVHVCPSCLGPLEPVYPPDRVLPDRAELTARPRTLWRYREWLPFAGRPTRCLDAGWTPLIHAPRLAAALGVAHCWVKNDAVSFPSLSFKDRVVATALNAAHAFGLQVVGCASTGNLANAVAAAAAREGLEAWIFIPHDLEAAKVLATAAFGPRLVRVRGTYDDVNRLCSQVADGFRWGIVNVNLRAYYGEGSGTMAFEIAEQLGWRLPNAVVAPMAGGSLLTRLARGFAAFRDAGLVADPAPRLFGAQATGCAPIVRLLERGDDTIVPERPHTIARSLAIGNPADGRSAVRAIRASGGWAAAVDDPAIVAGIRLLAETTGIFGETAAGVTVAAARELAARGRLSPDDEVVLCITGNGLKTLDAVQDAIPLPEPIAPRLAAVAALAERAG
ncbi:MAG TPA: threonine synthase [Gemmatimonadaceae bacterium]